MLQFYCLFDALLSRGYDSEEVREPLLLRWRKNYRLQDQNFRHKSGVAGSVKGGSGWPLELRLFTTFHELIRNMAINKLENHSKSRLVTIKSTPCRSSSPRDGQTVSKKRGSSTKHRRHAKHKEPRNYCVKRQMFKGLIFADKISPPQPDHFPLR